MGLLGGNLKRLSFPLFQINFGVCGKYSTSHSRIKIYCSMDFFATASISDGDVIDYKNKAITLELNAN